MQFVRVQNLKTFMFMVINAPCFHAQLLSQVHYPKK